MPQTRKVALVSGGSRGLGAELVSGFLDRRYGVATLSRTRTAFIANLLRARKPRDFHWRLWMDAITRRCAPLSKKCASGWAELTCWSTMPAWQRKESCQQCARAILLRLSKLI